MPCAASGLRIDPDFALDPWLNQLVELALALVLDAHVGEQVAEIRLIDAQHLLHGQGREADLLPGDLFAGSLPLGYVGKLNRIGILGRKLRAPGERRDLLTVALGGEELLGKGAKVDRSWVIVRPSAPGKRVRASALASVPSLRAAPHKIAIANSVTPGADPGLGPVPIRGYNCEWTAWNGSLRMTDHGCEGGCPSA